MAHYQCYECSGIMVAEETPERCESCGAPAAEAFPDSTSVEDSVDPEPVDHLFDVPGQAQQRWNPAAVTTLELDEEDLEQVEDGPRLVTPAMTAPLPPTPLQARPVKPMVGRVAYPVAERDDQPRERHHVELDEMVAAGLPPLPPRPEQALASQTKSLSDLRARRQPLQPGRLVAAVGPLAVLAGIAVAVLWPRGEPVSVGSIDSSLPTDAAPARDLAPDLPRPDLRRPRDTGHHPDRLPTPAPAAPAAPAPRPAPVRPAPVRPAPVRPAPVRPAPAAAPVAQKTADEHYRAGLKLLLQGKLDDAVVQLNRALDRNPRLSQAYRGLGLAYQKLGRAAMAREAYQRYLELRPDAPDTDAIRRRMTGP